ncbi:hypothetical protein TcG_11311 [Trypanosoma cruzi]|nr:hypothetical protein TcG_11311 [Trypanosoma cruzi]
MELGMNFQIPDERLRQMGAYLRVRFLVATFAALPIRLDWASVRIRVCSEAPVWSLREDASRSQKQRSASHAARSSSGVRTGTVFVLPLRTPTSQSAEQLCGCHSRHVCGRPLYYR